MILAFDSVINWWAVLGETWTFPLNDLKIKNFLHTWIIPDAFQFSWSSPQNWPIPNFAEKLINEASCTAFLTKHGKYNIVAQSDSIFENIIFYTIQLFTRDTNSGIILAISGLSNTTVISNN